MRKSLVFIFLLLTISAVLAQYESYGEAVLGLDDQESQFDFENNDYDHADGEEQNTLFWGSVSRAFRRGFDRVKDAGRRVGDFGRRAANRVGDFGRSSWRATRNFGSNSWRATRNFGVNSWRATSNFGARAVRSTANFGSNSWRATRNFGVNSWRATRNFGVNSWRTTRDFSVRTYETARDKLEDVFAPSIPKNLGVKVASSNGPRYTRPIRNLREAVQAYAPIVYLSRGEQWFPTSAERLGDWTKVPANKLDDEKWMLPLRKDLNGFDQRAPVYVNVRDQAVPGKVLISYGFLYHYNDCGPHVRAAARASFINFDERIYPCPIGIHNGDIEHVTLYLDARTLRVESVYHAYHAFGDNVKPTEVEWEGTRPVFYSAQGSHATYLTGEKQQYVKLWKESTKAAYTFGFLEDYPERGLRWDTTARWLVYNGKINPAVTGPISSDEYKFAKFKGTLGPQIKPASAEKIKKSLYAITWPARKLKSSWDDAISAQIKSLDSELQPTSINCIGGKGWWSGTLEDV